MLTFRVGLGGTIPHAEQPLKSMRMSTTKPAVSQLRWRGRARCGCGARSIGSPNTSTHELESNSTCFREMSRAFYGHNISFPSRRSFLSREFRPPGRSPYKQELHIFKQRFDVGSCALAAVPEQGSSACATLHYPRAQRARPRPSGRSLVFDPLALQAARRAIG